MKKILLTLGIVSLLCSSNIVFAGEFDSISGLTPVQKQKLTQIHFNYKQDYNNLETRIMSDSSKLAQLKKSQDKTQDQISLLSSAYERNIKTLKDQQKQLEERTNALYKQVMTEEQFNQFIQQQAKVEDSFNEFLKK